MITQRDRIVLCLAGVVCAVAAFGLPMVHHGPAFGWQVLLGLGGVAALGATPWQPGGPTFGAVLLAATAALALIDTEFPFPALAFSGVAGLASIEALTLLRMWTVVGARSLAAERAHLAAAGRRCAVGAGAAAVVVAVGFVHLPAPGVIAAAGVIATAAVVAVLTARNA